MPVLRETLAAAETESIGIRQQKLMGGAYSENESKEAEKDREDARLNLEAGERALVDLKSELSKTVALELETEKKKIEAERETLKLEFKLHRGELFQRAAELTAFKKVLTSISIFA